MGWSVKIGSSGQFTPVSGGLSIRFLHKRIEQLPIHPKYWERIGSGEGSLVPEMMKLSKKTINEINKYNSPNNMLVVNVAGIRRLDTPIKVKCITSVGPVKRGMVLNVTAVKVTTTNKLLYLIRGQYFLYHCFVILTK